MACGTVETNRVEQFHIDGSRVNVEQVRRHRHFYLLHSDVSESTIDCDMFALAVDTYIARAVCLNNTDLVPPAMNMYLHSHRALANLQNLQRATLLRGTPLLGGGNSSGQMNAEG